MTLLSMADGSVKHPSVGDKVQVFSGYTNRPLSVGTVVRVTKTMVTLKEDRYCNSVRYRLGGQLSGKHIIGGLAEYMNDYVEIHVSVANLLP